MPQDVTVFPRHTIPLVLLEEVVDEEEESRGKDEL